MKSVLLLSCIALLLVLSNPAVAKDKGTIQVLTYPGDNCTGTPTSAYTPIDVCFPLSGGNFTAFKFEPPTTQKMIKIHASTKPNCSALRPEADYIACDQCTYSPVVDEYFRFHCDDKKQELRLDVNCSAGCGDCMHMPKQKVGSCNTYLNQSWYFDSIIPKMPIVPQTLYEKSNGTCPSDSKHSVTYLQPCGACLGKWIFNCTAPKQDDMPVFKNLGHPVIGRALRGQR